MTADLSAFELLSLTLQHFFFPDLNELCIIFSYIVVLHLEIQVSQSKQLSISAVVTQAYWEHHFTDCEEKLVLQGNILQFITIRTCVFLSLWFHREKSMCLFISLSPTLPTSAQQVIDLCRILMLRVQVSSHYICWSDKGTLKTSEMVHKGSFGESYEKRTSMAFPAATGFVPKALQYKVCTIVIEA